jgi:hypothetical protein
MINAGSHQGGWRSFTIEHGNSQLETAHLTRIRSVNIAGITQDGAVERHP